MGPSGHKKRQTDGLIGAVGDGGSLRGTPLIEWKGPFRAQEKPDFDLAFLVPRAGLEPARL